MSSKSRLRLDWCDEKAAMFACKRWHYSRITPGAWRKTRIGVWEDGTFNGCLIFINPMPPVWKRFKCENTEIAELARVALGDHKNQVSRIIAVARRMLMSVNPGLKLLVSYADTGQGHHGGIYQASGFSYFGANGGGREYLYQGRWVHPRAIGRDIKKGKITKGQGWSLPNRPSGVKHCYAMAIPGRGYQFHEPEQPFPKRVRSDTSDTSGSQPEEGGATPTRTLSPDKPI
jgi:hypothetical protein